MGGFEAGLETRHEFVRIAGHDGHRLAPGRLAGPPEGGQSGECGGEQQTLREAAVHQVGGAQQRAAGGGGR